ADVLARGVYHVHPLLNPVQVGVHTAPCACRRPRRRFGTMRAVTWQTHRLGPEYDALAPDGSQIRLLVQVDRGSMVHCSLPPGAVTRAVRHRSVEEVWLCLAGRGQLWRRAAPDEAIVDLEPGVAVSIPV